MALKKVGALWEKEKGQKFWSGMITINNVETNILVFNNKHKEKDAHPDLTIHIREDDEEKPQEDGAPF